MSGGMASSDMFDGIAARMRDIGNTPSINAAVERDAAAPQSTSPKITMNFSNQTGQNVKASTGTPKFDGEAWVIDTVIKNANQPGNLRNALKGMT